MPTKSKPVCETIRPWLKANLGNDCLAPLTGQDSRALSVAVHAMQLYASCDELAEPHALSAFAAAANCMQPSTRHLAYHAIAHVLDWGDRANIWIRSGLDIIAVGRCKFE